MSNPLEYHNYSTQHFPLLNYTGPPTRRVCQSLAVGIHDEKDPMIRKNCEFDHVPHSVGSNGGAEVKVWDVAENS